MKRKGLMILGLIVLVCVIATTIDAQGVLKPSQRSPEQVVAVRKFAMGAMGANAGDLEGKIKAGNIKRVAANAVSIAALANFLPLIYEETYLQVYPVKGSEYFFKGAPQADTEAGYESLRIQAQKLMTNQELRHRQKSCLVPVEVAIKHIEASISIPPGEGKRSIESYPRSRDRQVSEVRRQIAAEF